MTTHMKTQAKKLAERMRRCLLCSDNFHSEGSHNRVCRRCKSSQMWRQGWL